MLNTIQLSPKYIYNSLHFYYFYIITIYIYIFFLNQVKVTIIP